MLNICDSDLHRLIRALIGIHFYSVVTILSAIILLTVMGFIPKNKGLTCEQCGTEVPKAQGTFRNHCPQCLWSKHVDGNNPGDRKATCQGSMKPMMVEMSSKSHWRILHQCTQCPHQRWNRSQPDDEWSTLLTIQQAAAEAFLRQQKGI